jgi:hypothetical protein
MPVKKLPDLSVEDCDLLADCICLVEMFTDYLTEEQARRLKAFTLAIQPRKRHRHRDVLGHFLPMLEARIKDNLGDVSKSCREIGDILREDPKRLRNLHYAARRRR